MSEEQLDEHEDDLVEKETPEEDDTEEGSDAEEEGDAEEKAPEGEPDETPPTNLVTKSDVDWEAVGPELASALNKVISSHKHKTEDGYTFSVSDETMRRVHDVLGSVTA